MLYVQAELQLQTGVKEGDGIVSSDLRQPSKVAKAPLQPAHIRPASKPQTAFIAAERPSALPEPIGYLPVEVVDQAAEPLGDWVIDTNVLPPGRSLHVELKLWISSTGVIDQWELSGVEEDDQALAQLALARVSSTLFQPAFLNSSPVPNFRQLEIVLIR